MCMVTSMSTTPSSKPDRTKSKSSLKLKLGHSGADGGLHYWLLDGGEVRAYAKIYERSEASGTVIELCDIETRKGFRNRGYATAILELLARGYGVDQVCHGGSYTELGMRHIASRVKRIGMPAGSALYSPMSFVEDWATLSPLYP